MNGILEMEGFQDTFHQLYNNDEISRLDVDDYSMLIPNDTTDTTDMTDTAANSTCSSGNGASSDILIVSVWSHSSLWIYPSNVYMDGSTLRHFLELSN